MFLKKVTSLLNMLKVQKLVVFLMVFVFGINLSFANIAVVSADSLIKELGVDASISSYADNSRTIYFPVLEPNQYYSGKITITGVIHESSYKFNPPYVSYEIYGIKNDGSTELIGRKGLSGNKEENTPFELVLFTDKRYPIIYVRTILNYYSGYEYYASVSATARMEVYGPTPLEMLNDEIKRAKEAAEQALSGVNEIRNQMLNFDSQLKAIKDQMGSFLTLSQAQAYFQNLERNLNQQIQNIQQVVNSKLPPVLNSVSGLNGANATSSGSLQVVIDASNASVYRYRIDNGSWSAWQPYAETVSIPIPRGVHTLTIQVANLDEKGNPGPTAQKSMQVIGL